jgi:hypothetical protein
MDLPWRGATVRWAYAVGDGLRRNRLFARPETTERLLERLRHSANLITVLKKELPPSNDLATQPTEYRPTVKTRGWRIIVNRPLGIDGAH